MLWPAGVSTSAFFFAHITLHLLDILVQPLVFMSLYYTLILPQIAFFDFYISKLLDLLAGLYSFPLQVSHDSSPEDLC